MSDPLDVEALREQILDNQKIIDGLNKSLTRKAQEVRIIQQIAAEINATLDLDEILRIILSSMDSIFGFRHSMVLLVDEGAEELRVAASRGYPKSGVGAVVPFGQGPIGMVAKRRKMMRMGSIGTQLAYAAAVRATMVESGESTGQEELPTLPGLPDVQSQVAIPLLIKDRLVGVFAVESATSSIFDERDEILIGILADQAASAIHNALLYRTEEERRQELDRLNETLEEKVKERTHDLQRAQAQLVQSEKMASLGMLVAGIAHEINTPMGSIVSMHDTLFRASDKLRTLLSSELPSGSASTSKIDSLLAMMGDAGKTLQIGTERVTTIVKRLKSFARLDEAERKQADLHQGLEDTLSLMAHELGAVKVTRRYGDVPPLTCFPGRLNQVFLNVLLNARQALGAQGEIVITTTSTDEAVRVTIADDGVGIAPKDLERVFDPGFTTKGVGVGTGLGLSICYQIVQDHQGQLTIESTLAQGTTVTVVLPRLGTGS